MGVLRKKRIFAGFLTLIIFCGLSSFSYNFFKKDKAIAANKPPNIIIIMADDMGFSDIGCYGGEISTPHIDKLGRNGLRFTQFYNTARCCPSRASLLTGQYPHKAGMGEMVGSKNYAGYLLPSAITVAEALKGVGYNTYMSGKWHVGEDSSHWPLQRGFDKYYGLISGASSFYELDPGRIMLENNRRIKPDENFYATRAYTDKALQFLKEGHDQKKPYFLYLAYTAPHWPLHAPEADVQKYIGKYKAGWEELRKQRYQRQLKEGIISSNAKLSALDPAIEPWSQEPDKAQWDRRMAVYAAMISIMDEGIGKIVERLKAQNDLDNTIIFFLSDNGGCAEVPHVYKEKLKTMTEEELTANVGDKTSYVGYEDRWASASNTPFQRYKQYTHEGGIASPLIVHWPAKIKKPGLVPDMAHIMDIIPTCLEIAGTAYPKMYRENKLLPPDGKSLAPLFEDKKWAGHDVLIWEHFGSKAIRQKNWKLVAAKNGPWELYDMQADRSETNNLAEKMPEKVAELKKLYLQKAAAAGVKKL